MADNTELNAGSGGDTYASDDVAGVKHQRVKISLGADGAATDALGGAGAVAAGVQRVTLASDDPAVAELVKLALQTADYDTGAGTDTAVMMGIALPASGGAVAGGTATNPIQVGDAGGTLTVDDGGTTISIDDGAGSITVDNGGTFAVQATLAAGSASIGILGANSGVDIGDVDVTSVVPGTGATNLGKAEDAAHSSGDVGVQMLAVRTDTPANRSGTDGDYEPLQIKDGLVWARLKDIHTAAGQSVINDTADTIKVSIHNATTGAALDPGSEYTEGNQDTEITGTAIMWEDASDTMRSVSAAKPLPVQLQASTGATEVVGDSAHDDPVAGNPVRVGAFAEASVSGRTLVADGDTTNLLAGLDGVQIVRNHTNLEDIVVGNASNTDGASTEVIAAAGAGIKQYLTAITLINSSASFAYCEVRSGTTVRWRFPVPATGGVTHSWDPPLPPNAANEAWNFDMSAATTTAYCSMEAFKSKV